MFHRLIVSSVAYPCAFTASQAFASCSENHHDCQDEVRGNSFLRLVFIRHGESSNNVLRGVSEDFYRRHRQPDPDLTQLGEAQAAIVAAHLANENSSPAIRIDKLLVSPMKRALSTAKPIAAALNVSCEICVDIFEVGGLYSSGHEREYSNEGIHGLGRSDIQAMYPNYIVPARVGASGWWFGDKETRSQAERRAHSVAKQLRGLAMNPTSHPESLPSTMAKEHKTVGIVCHGDILSLILNALICSNETESGQEGKPSFPVSYFDSWNGSLAALDIDSEGKVRVLFINNAMHLYSHTEVPMDLRRIGTGSAAD